MNDVSFSGFMKDNYPIRNLNTILCQIIALQPQVKQIGQLFVVEILHQEVGIAVNADFGQLDQCCITSVAVHGLHKLASHLQAHAPVLVAEILGRRFGDIVAE